MNNKKNIDRLFQEKFKDFEVAPSDIVWDRISEDLPNKKKKRRVIPLWWQIGGAAAVIALLLTVGISVFNSNDENNQDLPIVNTKDNEKENLQENTTNPSPDTKQNDLKSADNNTKVAELESDKTDSNIKENDSPQENNVSNKLTTPNKSPLKSNAVVNNVNEKEKTTTQKRSNINTVVNNKISKVADNTSSKNIDTNKKEDNSDVKSTIKKNLKDDKTVVADNSKSTLSKSTSQNSESNKIDKKSELKSTIKENIKDSNTAVTDNTSSKEVKDDSKTDKTNTLVENPKEKESIENAIAESDPINEKEEDEQNRWSIAPNVAPVYFSSFGEGSPMHSQFNENSKSGDVNMSYGITGSYAISKKLKIRAGISRVNLNHITSDVYSFASADAAARGDNAQISNIDFKNGVQSLSFLSASALDRSSTPEIFNSKIPGSLDQRFGFIEVPLELEYKLLDKKFGINVIGGFSTFFLSNNEIYADVDGVTTLIGEANNINSTSFSANFGLGLDYNLSKQWNINLEPTFKYQINTFNNTSGNFKPFFIGVYTGLKFKF